MSTLTTSSRNVVLDNLSLYQLVKVPTHRRGHTLDWLITNRATDVLDLTVFDMLLSDHFVISFDLLLRNPVREIKKIISRNIRANDMHGFRKLRQMFTMYLGQPLSLTDLIP